MFDSGLYWFTTTILCDRWSVLYSANRKRHYSLLCLYPWQESLDCDIHFHSLFIALDKIDKWFLCFYTWPWHEIYMGCCLCLDPPLNLSVCSSMCMMVHLLFIRISSLTMISSLIDFLSALSSLCSLSSPFSPIISALLPLICNVESGNYESVMFSAATINRNAESSQLRGHRCHYYDNIGVPVSIQAAIK